MQGKFRLAVAVCFFFASAYVYAGYDDYQSQYLKNVVLPDCDANRADVQIIRNNSDWNAINDSSKTIFCVAPGNYLGAGVIQITSSGTANSPRILRSANAVGNPWTQSQADQAVVKSINISGAANWVVHGLVVTDPNYDIRDAALLTVSDNSNNIIVDNVLIEDAAFRLFRVNKASDNVTLQRSVVRNIRVPILGNYEGMCVNLQVSDEHGASENIHIVDNELYGCAGDSIQMISSTKEAPRNGFRGVVIENNDMFVPRAHYTNCETGELDPSGDCACAENAIDIKINVIEDNPSQADYARVLHNRMWGHRQNSQAGNTCGTSGDVFAAAIVMHWTEADYVLFKDNIVMDAENGIWMTKSGVDHVSVIGNLFYDVANKTKPKAVLAIDAGSNFEAYNNAIVNSERYLLTGGGKNIDLRNNLAVGSGTWMPHSSAGDYSSTEATIGNNYYYSTVQYDGRASIAGDIVQSSVGAANTSNFCFTRTRLTNPDLVCIPNVRSSGSSPHVGMDDAAAGTLRDVGVDDSIPIRANIWDDDTGTANSVPKPPVFN